MCPVIISSFKETGTKLDKIAQFEQGTSIKESEAAIFDCISLILPLKKVKNIRHSSLDDSH